MSDLDAGNVNYSSGLNYLNEKYSYAELSNPANGTGTIDTIFLKLRSVGAPTVGTLYGTSSSLTVRDSVFIGDLPSGVVHEVTGLSIDVETDDFIGLHSSGKIRATYTGTIYTTGRSGNHFTSGGTLDYTGEYPHKLCLYGTGETAGGGATSKTINIRLGNLYAQNIQVLSSIGWTKGKIN